MVRLKDLFTEPPHGYLSTTKLWTHIGGVAITTALIVQSNSRDLGLESFVGYALAVSIVTSPVLAQKIIGLKFGQSQGQQPKEEKPSGQS